MTHPGGASLAVVRHAALRARRELSQRQLDLEHPRLIRFLDGEYREFGGWRVTIRLSRPAQTRVDSPDRNVLMVSHPS
jgi:hypothetical protein